MSLLVDYQIRRLAEGGFIRNFANYGVSQRGEISYGLSSAGYDIRLGCEFKVFTPVHCTVIDPKNFDPKAFVEVVVERPGDYCLIPPNSFALGVSLEWLEIPESCLGIVLGKSTLARCGVITNFTPLEPGWRGHVTVEISNTAPLPAKVYAGEGIAQVLYLNLDARPERIYSDKPGAKYQDQVGIVLPRVQ